MNSDMVKPEKFGRLHLVYHFTLPLNTEIPIFVIFGVKSVSYWHWKNFCVLRSTSNIKWACVR